VGALAGMLLALGISLLLYVVPVTMPPPPGSSRGYALNITIDSPMYGATALAIVVLATLASAWVAHRTVHMPIVTALAHT
jgi:putative ABC transport system permease protein